MLLAFLTNEVIILVNHVVSEIEGEEGGSFFEGLNLVVEFLFGELEMLGVVLNELDLLVSVEVVEEGVQHSEIVKVLDEGREVLFKEALDHLEALGLAGVLEDLFQDELGVLRGGELEEVFLQQK